MNVGIQILSPLRQFFPVCCNDNEVELKGTPQRMKIFFKKILTALGLTPSILLRTSAVASPIPSLTQLIAATSPLCPHDRIVFVGDSITYFGGKSGGYVDLIRKALANRQDLKLQIEHYGISGARTADLWVGKTRWGESNPYAEILKGKPTIVVIYIGVNDAWHDPETNLEIYRSNLTHLVSEAKSTNAIVILATPAIIGENLVPENSKNIVLEQYAQISRQVAEAETVTLCDLRQAFMDYLQAHHLHNPDRRLINRGLLTSDGVHMNAQGNRLIADWMGRSLWQALTTARSAQ
jgi:lysophospholipase L1-like esterase